MGDKVIKFLIYCASFNFFYDAESTIYVNRSPELRPKYQLIFKDQFLSSQIRDTNSRY